MKKTHFSALRLGAAPLVLGVGLLAAAPAMAQDAQGSEDSATSGDEIIVTGTRIPQANLESAAPITVVSQEDIKLQGTTRVEDLLNSLPSVFASQNSTTANGSDGTASVDLRGLGTTRTLSLVNGRRLLPGDPSPSSGSAADINIIPAALLKNVQVLTGGASATYGADAVAGVVNFVMDTDFTGFRLDGQYSLYQHNNRNKFLPPLLDRRGFGYPRGSTADGGTIDVTATFGAAFDDGRGHIVAYAGYRKANEITQAKRDYSSCVLQEQRRRCAAVRRLADQLGGYGDPVRPDAQYGVVDGVQLPAGRRVRKHHVAVQLRADEPLSAPRRTLHRGPVREL